MLQFGHGAEAVENANRSRNDRRLREELQFGHGAEAVENATRAPLARRRRSRFNSATALRPWRTDSPSAAAPVQTVLQFGHGAEAVENNAACGGSAKDVQASIRPRR